MLYRHVGIAKTGFSSNTSKLSKVYRSLKVNDTSIQNTLKIKKHSVDFDNVQTLNNANPVFITFNYVSTQWLTCFDCSVQ